MTWNQIENKWAAMTRRVRADWKGAMQDEGSKSAEERNNTLTDKKLSIVLVSDVHLPKTIAASAE